MTDLGWTVVERRDGVWLLDHIGACMTHEQAVDWLAREGAEWPDAKLALARISIEGGES